MSKKFLHFIQQMKTFLHYLKSYKIKKDLWSRLTKRATLIFWTGIDVLRFKVYPLCLKSVQYTATFLQNKYEAIRTSPSTNGPNRFRVLLCARCACQPG